VLETKPLLLKPQSSSSYPAMRQQHRPPLIVHLVTHRCRHAARYRLEHSLLHTCHPHVAHYRPLSVSMLAGPVSLRLIEAGTSLAHQHKP